MQRQWEAGSVTPHGSAAQLWQSTFMHIDGTRHGVATDWAVTQWRAAGNSSCCPINQWLAHTPKLLFNCQLVGSPGDAAFSFVQRPKAGRVVVLIIHIYMMHMHVFITSSFTIIITCWKEHLCLGRVCFKALGEARRGLHLEFLPQILVLQYWPCFKILSAPFRQQFGLRHVHRELMSCWYEHVWTEQWAKLKL